MLQVSFIRENKARVLEGLAIRNFKDTHVIDEVLQVDEQRKVVLQQTEDLNAEANQLAKQIGGLYKSGKREEAEVLKSRSGEIKESSKDLQVKLSELNSQLDVLLKQIPNIPNVIVPGGNSDEDNVEIFKAGDFPQLGDAALPHWELASKYNLIDFDLGAKITGAGFPVYLGKGARLQRALINYFLDYNTEAGFKEVLPPLMVNEASGIGTGQLPDKEGQMYHVTKDDLYLIPTAEVPVTNIYRDVILKENELPVKMTAYTPCFRREAGSYGAHVRGLNRLHQFDKVEVVQITKPEDSYTTLEAMVKHVEVLIQNLGLPYRILRLCGGDLGFTSALTYDFEIYSAGQERWLEVSSISNFETYQANRLKLRYRGKDKKTHLCHTLNGSSLALPRILAGLLEKNQTDEGINIPEVLKPYCGFEMIK